MQLKYRGIAYIAPKAIQAASTEVAEGKYHGIKTQISLPQVAESIDNALGLMVYRGIQIATS